MKLRLILVGLLFVVSPFFPAYAAADSDHKYELALKLAKTTMPEEELEQAMNLMMDSITSMSDAEDGEKMHQLLRKFFAEINFSNVALERIADIYAEELDEATMKGTLDFYNTKAGKELLSKQSKIMEQSMLAGQNIVQENLALLMSMVETETKPS